MSRLRPASNSPTPRPYWWRRWEQITAATPTASQVKAKMVTLDGSFDVANDGCRSFRDFLAKLGHRVRTVGCSGHDITLALVDQSGHACAR